MSTKLERTPSLIQVPRSPAVARPAAIEPAKPEALRPAAPAATFVAEPPARGPELTGERPASLGEPTPAFSSVADFDPWAFAKLPDVEQRHHLHHLHRQGGELNSQIDSRLGQLDRKWRGCRTSTRAEALREYQETSRSLNPGARHRLDGMLDRAERAQRRINELRAESDRLGPSSRGDHAARRRQVAGELEQARAEQTTAVAEATTLIEDQGLETDLLVKTEQTIDPQAPKPSLFELLTKFFHLDSFVRVVSNVVDTLRKTDDQRDAERRREHQVDAARARTMADELVRRLDEQRSIAQDDRAWLERLKTLKPT
jgi:hypothetical protein